VLALILNELVGNAAKHAFGKDGRGARRNGLSVSLRGENEELVLRVKDNGPGLPADFDLARHSQVGLDVVRTLAERDLDGRLTLLSQGGVLAEVRFVW
jgi:two-component sensor histidine kinase